MDKINIGLLGFGTVGKGVYSIINNHQDQLKHQVGCSVEITKILVRDINKIRDIELPTRLLTTDAQEVIENNDIIIEVIGGTNVAKDYIISALKQGKHIVTANKDLMALYSQELLSTAYENNCDLLYEASVGGGIPIIRSLANGLAADKTTKIIGIVNGTTNYILTKMNEDNLSYEEALAKAQQLGFAEANPDSDVKGLDAARKMVILSTLGFSMPIELNDIRTRGITEINEEDLKYAKELGYTVKLLGIANKDLDGVEVSVEPALIPFTHPLASVKNEFNAIFLVGDAVGETMFYGPGAGSLPTATAIVSDLLDVIKNLKMNVNGQFMITPRYKKEIKDKKKQFLKYYMNMSVKDEVGTLAVITSLFTKYNISFEKVLQKPFKQNNKAEIIIITHHASLFDMESMLEELKETDVVFEIKSYYRIEER